MIVTSLQADMLRRIAEDECTPVNGARPTRREDADTWLTSVVRTKEDTMQQPGFTDVLNLATGEIVTYNLPPEQAVWAAFQHGQKNRNWWIYPPPILTRGKRTVAAGDWCALI